MADLAATAVSISNSGYKSGINGKRYKTRDVVLTLTSQGTTSNKILAGVLGLSAVAGCDPLVQDDNTDIVVGAPSYDGTVLLLKAAGSNAPADYTGTFKTQVWGT